MEKVRFEDLEADLATLLVEQDNSLGDLIVKIDEVRDNIEPTLFDHLISELKTLRIKKEDIEKKIAQLYTKAIVDMTSLHTRTYLNDFIDRDDFERPLAYLFGDIDNFKLYNDTYEHLQGDEALKLIGYTFRETIKQGLHGEEDALIARYGGEEFCAYISRFDGDEEELENRAEAIRQAVKELVIPKYREDAPLDEGYQKRTITIAGVIGRLNEHPLSLHEIADKKLLASKVENKKR